MSDKGKTRILLPSIKALVDKAASISAVDAFPEELTTHLLASYDTESAATLNGDPEAWEVFLEIARTYLRPGMYVAQPSELHVKLNVKEFRWRFRKSWSTL